MHQQLLVAILVFALWLNKQHVLLYLYPSMSYYSTPQQQLLYHTGLLVCLLALPLMEFPPNITAS